MLEEEQFIEENACISFVHQNVIIEATVKIKPRVTIGEEFTIECGDFDLCRLDDDRPSPKQRVPKKRSRNYYDDEPVIVRGSRHSRDEDCTYYVRQELCLKIPLIFSAEATIKNEKTVISDPCVEPCDYNECD